MRARAGGRNGHITIIIVIALYDGRGRRIRKAKAARKFGLLNEQ